MNFNAQTVASKRMVRYANGYIQIIRTLIDVKNQVASLPGGMERLYPGSLHRHTVKAAVAPGTTLDSLFAGPLAPLGQYAEGFIEFARPLSAFGRIQGMRKVPFRQRLPRGTSGTTVGWTAESSIIPVTQMTFDQLTPSTQKLTGIVVVTDDLITFSDPDADALLRDDLARATAQAIDTSFLDPSSFAIVGIRPASVTWSAPSAVSSGNPGTDVKSLFNLLTVDPVSPVFLMKPKTAVGLAAIDSQLTKDIGANGGFLAGVPVITSANVPTDGSSPLGGTIVLIDADTIAYSDGGIDISASREATIMMDSTPDSPPIPSSVATSFFQQNLAGLRMVRYLNWLQRRSGGVAYLTGVTY